MTKKEKATEDILKILNDFEPEEWDELIGENSRVQLMKRDKIADKRLERTIPLFKRLFGVDF